MQSLRKLGAFVLWAGAGPAVGFAAFRFLAPNEPALAQASLVLFLLPMILPALYLGVSLCGRASQIFLATAFPPLVFTTSVVFSLTALGQAGLLLAYFDAALRATMGYAPPFLFWGAAVGLTLPPLHFIRQIFTALHRPALTVAGHEIAASVNCGLWRLVREVCDDAGAREPAALVVGMEPYCYATYCAMRLIEGPELPGPTLYVSALLARFLDERELKALIAHEMSHLCGRGALYARRFVPLYAGLAKMGRYCTGPARATLEAMQALFAPVEERLTLRRERRADQSAAKLATPWSLASGLVKATFLSAYWSEVRRQNAVLLAEGRVMANFGGLYDELIAQTGAQMRPDRLFDALARQRIPHPTDALPPLAARAETAGADLRKAFAAALHDLRTATPEERPDLLPKGFEDELTLAAHRALMLATPRKGDLLAEEKRVA